MKNSRWYTFLILAAWWQLFLPKTAFAISSEKKFIIDYDIVYDVQENGETVVKQKATLTNLQNENVPTAYSFTIKAFKIYDLTAETNGKKSTPIVESGDSSSTVQINITNQAIGKDKQNAITTTFKTKDIALETGTIWNLFIPKIQVPDTTDFYNVKIYVPKAFGPKVFFSPLPASEKSEKDKDVYYLTKDTFRGTGVNAAFGDRQVINFKIKYQLENPTILIIPQEIALPPDVDNYQQVAYKNLSIKPVRTRVDRDGNILALYILMPKQKKEITLEGSANIYTQQISPDKGKPIETIPKDLVSRYTKAKKYWEVKSSAVISSANKLKNNNLNTIKNAQLAFNYVVDNLTYDYTAIKKDFVERQGALIALTQKGSWTCMEFSDLFIALTRTMGVPSREVDGYAFSNSESYKPISINLKNGDLLHAWAEYYDVNYGWIQVDPTWARTSGIDYFTKTDMSHFTLVRKGLDPDKPYPAGSYRFADNSKLIDIDYSQNDSVDIFTPRLTITKVFNYNLVQVIKGNSRYIIENTGQVFIYNIGGKNIKPFEKASIYLNKDAKLVSFETIDGTKHEVSL